MQPLIKMTYFRIILNIISVLCCFVQVSSASESEKNPVRVTLISSVKGTGEKEPLTIGLDFKIDPSWKLYAHPPKDAENTPFGQPPEIDWSGSKNLESAEILWPPGEWDGEGFYRTYVYKKSVIIPVKVKLLDETKPLILKGKVTYFACSTTCRPFEQAVELTLNPIPATLTPQAGPIQAFEKKAEDFEREQDLEEAASLVFMLFMALLGGFILNFMPCILPVLSLKIIGLTKSHHPHVRAKFLVTTAGILVSFLLLAILIITLKSLGIAVGWGFHFQEPLFLGFMTFLMILFALNLYGLFEIPLPQFIAQSLSIRGKGLVGDFFSGVFASLLATPCSAPFLGTAISFALAQGPAEILILFTALGIGFSAPYILGAFLPEKWIRLPKPGKWMKYFQIVLASALLITALWLGGILVAQLTKPQEEPLSLRKGELEWLPFNEQKISELVAEGKTVFIDITAKWCVTCHVNKLVALNDPTVIAYLRRKNVALMRGDLTHSNQLIAQYLEKHKRYGIPFNALYSPEFPLGIILPEILTPTAVRDAFESLKKR